MLALSGHKLHAPKGIGACSTCKKGTPFVPFIKGGHQEHGRRAGTEERALHHRPGHGPASWPASAHGRREHPGQGHARQAWRRACWTSRPPWSTAIPRSTACPNTSCSVSFEYVEGESILLHLSAQGICASSRQRPAPRGSLEPSHVLRAMGVPLYRGSRLHPVSPLVFTTPNRPTWTTCWSTCRALLKSSGPSARSGANTKKPARSASTTMWSRNNLLK